MPVEWTIGATRCGAARRCAGLAATALAALSAATGVAGAERTLPHPAGYAEVRNACGAPAPGDARCYALLRRRVPSTAAGRAGVRPFTAGDGALAAGPAGGLTPQALETAYGYSAKGGSGQTIAVVDAFNDPNIEEDLAAFDAHYGLGACTKGNGCLRVVGQEGSATKLPADDKVGWSFEISLDVEAARATCNECRIVLVEANSASYANLAAAANEAVALGATAVSNSYGGPEEALNASERAAYDHPGVVVTAATGDDGYDDWNFALEGIEPPGMPNAPASLPSVVAVGGTSLHLRTDGTRAAETVWNDDGVEDVNGLGAGYVTGGGCSTLFTAPSWQAASPGFGAAGCAGRRLSADVATVGDPLTGFDVFDDFNFCGCEEVAEEISEYGGWETFGGTSLSSPMVAAMYALAGGSAGLADPGVTLYGHLGDGTVLFDVTEGGNGLCAGEPASVCGHPDSELDGTFDCEGTSACNARPGVDGPSGVGAPVGLTAFKPAFPTAVVTPPPFTVAGLPAVFSSSASTDPYPGGTLAGWTWSFGDGTGLLATPAPTHTYAAPGNYTVELTVHDALGLSSSTAELPLHVITEAEGRARREQEAAALAAAEEARRNAEAAARASAEQQAAARLRAELEAAALQASQHGVSPFKAGPPAARILGSSVRVTPAGAFKLHIACPAGGGACAGTVTLKSTTGGSRKGSGHTFVTLATARFRVAAGRTATVTMHLVGRSRAKLARARLLRARGTVSTRDTAGASATTHALLTLRPARARRRG
ncbi:MAG TPA: PKD domain-containing protein [Solirubrobacteraceae bacterium]|nr:PKD domain-containing protein [Solirubrobacteraceae bacterium]